MNGPCRSAAISSWTALLFAAVLVAPTLAAERTTSAPQGTDLWGGPGARGGGASGARFDTTIHVTSPAGASGTVDFYLGGAVAATSAFSVPPMGAASVPTPDSLAGGGPFLYRVRSDSGVSVWSETYNDTPNGRYGVGVGAFAASEFLNPGDEADGGGVDASTSTAAGRARTNIGILCNPGSGGQCQLEVAAFDGAALLGTGTVTANPGSAAQGALSTLVQAAAERSGLGLRLRVLSGSCLPYVIQNDNVSSDGIVVPLSVLRGSFSTAPAIGFFSGDPASGCAPLTVTLSWSTVGAVRVAISGVSGDLPPSGSTTTTVQATTDLVLTAFSSTGQTATQPIRVTILPPSAPPTPSPASGTTLPGGTIGGILPFPGINVTTAFTRHESTGSTFTISGSTFTYTAGTTSGVDVVELTNAGVCGAATATFVATVSSTLPPEIVSFTADPAVSCRLNNNIVLHWTTANAAYVNLAGYGPQALNGSIAVSFPPTDTDPTKTFDLSAQSADGQEATATLVVPVDPFLEYPSVSPSLVTVHTFTSQALTISGITNTGYLNFYIVQMPSGGSFSLNRAGPTAMYHSGSVRGVTDIIRITYHNGCGSSFTEFRANVQ